MRWIIAVTITMLFLAASGLGQPAPIVKQGSLLNQTAAPLTITVLDLTTGLPITQGETLNVDTLSVQATMAGNGQACIGSFIASEGTPFGRDGIPEALPTGGFNAVPFTLNTDINTTNSFTTAPFYPFGYPNLKITVNLTSVCNGVIGVSGTTFQFYILAP